MSSWSGARWITETLESLPWNQKEGQKWRELMKCFLKKRLSGACRMDLKAEGGSQKDQLLLQQALEDPLSLQMHRSTLLLEDFGSFRLCAKRYLQRLYLMMRFGS